MAGSCRDPGRRHLDLAPALLDRATVGAVRRAHGIDAEEAQAFAVARVVGVVVQRQKRWDAVLSLAAALESIRRGTRPLDAVATELRLVADRLVA